MNRSRWIAYLIIVAIILVLGYTSYTQEKASQAYIRFHVIANSDSPEDQALKLRVRDLLLDRFSKEFAGVESVEESRRIIRKNIKEIQAVAAQEVRDSGREYPVQVQLGQFDFPTKAYGSLVLPAGSYEALRVVIGKGEGANWWCVMFPPLCFVDITHGVAKGKNVNQEASSDPTQVLMADKTQDNDTGIKYRFRIAEWFKESGPKMVRMFSFLNSWE